MMMIVVAPLAVALVAFIIYALERKMKGEPISWEHASKFTVFGGLITAGVVFASGAEELPDLTKVVDVPTVQEMFVGLPTF